MPRGHRTSFCRLHLLRSALQAAVTDGHRAPPRACGRRECPVHIRSTTYGNLRLTARENNGGDVLDTQLAATDPKRQKTHRHPDVGPSRGRNERTETPCAAGMPIVAHSAKTGAAGGTLGVENEATRPRPPKSQAAAFRVHAHRRWLGRRNTFDDSRGGPPLLRTRRSSTNRATSLSTSQGGIPTRRLAGARRSG